MFKTIHVGRSSSLTGDEHCKVPAYGSWRRKLKSIKHSTTRGVDYIKKNIKEKNKGCTGY